MIVLVVKSKESGAYAQYTFPVKKREYTVGEIVQHKGKNIEIIRIDRDGFHLVGMEV